MNEFVISWPGPHRVSLIASAIIAAVFWSGSASAQSRPFNIPDLAAYNCAAVDAATAAGVRHMGQVIKGRYHEWHEIYANVGGEQRLACISLIVPEARQMSLGEARAFLKDAASASVPTAPSPATDNAPQAFQHTVVEPPDVKPMPLKRAIKPAPGTDLVEKKAGEIEVPPIPAVKSFKNTAPLPAENIDNSAAAPTAPPLLYENSQTVGVEDRAVVPNTLTYPWNTVGYLRVTYPSGNSFRCSGALVSAYVVLTAGHCIHSNTEGGYVSSVAFFPAQYQTAPGIGGPIRPYSNSDLAFVKTTQTWTQISGEDSYAVTQYRHDLAAVQFDTPFTYTSTFIPVVFGDTTDSITSAGYPAVVNGQSVQTQYFDDGPETPSSSSYKNFSVREFAVDASGGNSGGPFFALDPTTGQRRLVGILSYGQDDEAGGPWYSSFNQSLISDWMSYNPAASGASVEGLRVAAVFSSGQPTSRSFLRFYNSSTSAGIVEVTLADYVSGDVLGTWTSSSISAGAELQFFIQDIESGIDQTITPPTFYSISIRPTFTGYFQHVLWRPEDGTLTNLSTCDTTTASDSETVIGVHSSLLQNGYPSTLVVHNTGPSATNVVLGIYDARTGNKIADYSTGPIQANGQAIRTVAQIEAGVIPPPITPSGTMYHYVIKVESSFTGHLQHLVNNQNAGVITDMTSVCTLTP